MNCFDRTVAYEQIYLQMTFVFTTRFSSSRHNMFFVLWADCFLTIVNSVTFFFF